MAVKPINDQYLLTVDFTLPGGFGYVLNELHLNIEVALQQNFADAVVWRLSEATPATRSMVYLHVIAFPSGGRNGVSNLVRSTVVPAGSLTRTPIIPGSTGATQALSVQNLTAAATTAGEVNAVISFWEYDLEQIAYFAPHSGLNTVPR